MNEGFCSTVIAVDDILMVVQFVDMAHPSQVVPFGIGKDALVLDDTLGDWASTSCAVVVMHDEVLGPQRVVVYPNIQRATVPTNFNG